MTFQLSSKGAASIAPRALRVDDFGRTVGLSRTTIYELIKTGRLRAVRVAGRTIIPTSEADRLISEGEPLTRPANE
jgi:excisionase family DNA binding protein